MKSFVLIAIAMCLTMSSAKSSDLDASADSAVERTVQTCGACHGTNGRSVSPTFPNLAAQTAPYIEMQLKAFKDQSRGDPDAQAYMWGMAAQLSDSTITQLASYFAKQQPASGKSGKSGDAGLLQRGKLIFEGGVPARQTPPCASCHGAQAQGMATFPRLAGQHAPYLLKQLLVIQNALRNAPVMHGVVKDLTRDQMQAVAVYLESI